MTGSPSGPAYDVIVCGSLHLDIVVKAGALPRIDETAVGTSWAKVCGGKGHNQAVGAARAGARTAMIGRVGADEFGDALRGNLLTSGVDARAVETDADAGSGMSVAILQDDGNYGAVIVSGANARLDPARVPSLWDMLGGARALVLQNEIPGAVNAAAAAKAKECGAFVLLNAAPARVTDPSLDGLIDVLVVNRVEAEALADCPVPDRTAAARAAGVLSGLAPRVIVTLGGNGLVLRCPEAGLVEMEACHVDTVVSTHGAGDCFVGTLAAAFGRGVGTAEACRIASRAAARHVAGLKSVAQDERSG